jgi:hypothetical protein
MAWSSNAPLDSSGPLQLFWLDHVAVDRDRLFRPWISARRLCAVHVGRGTYILHRGRRVPFVWSAQLSVHSPYSDSWVPRLPVPSWCVAPTLSSFSVTDRVLLTIGDWKVWRTWAICRRSRTVLMGMSVFWLVRGHRLANAFRIGPGSPTRGRWPEQVHSCCRLLQHHRPNTITRCGH